MRKSIVLSFLSLAALGGALACSSDDGPTTPTAEKFRATLNGANEKPTARTTPGTAVAEVTFRRDTLAWQVTMSNMTNVTAAHIHIGDANTAGGILLGLTPGTSGVNNNKLEGFITRATFAAPGSPNQAVTFDNLLDMMRNGNQVYVNVHTNNTANDPTNNTGPGDFPAGEIRGQIAPEP